jgi:hypothetical protein
MGQPNEFRHIDDIDKAEKLRKLYKDRLFELKKTEAKMGQQTHPHITTEINDINEKLDELSEYFPQSCAYHNTPQYNRSIDGAKAHANNRWHTPNFPPIERLAINGFSFWMKIVFIISLIVILLLLIGSPKQPIISEWPYIHQQSYYSGTK